MTLSIKNGGYTFLIRLDLMLSMSLWKESQLLQTLNDLSIKHLIKLILYKDDVKLLDFKRRTVSINLWYVWIVRIWLKEYFFNSKEYVVKNHSLAKIALNGPIISLSLRMTQGMLVNILEAVVKLKQRYLGM